MADYLDGKIAIVTGSSRGIGEAIARHLASKGASLVLTYVSSSSLVKAEKVEADLKNDYKTRTVIVQADLATIDGPKTIVEETRKAFGDKIDVIINNAGVSECLLLEASTVEEFDKHYYLNVRGPMLLVQSAAEYLPKDGSGRIVNISSISSTIGFPQQTIYGGTKAALDSMTRTWSRELASRCTVNSVSVGPIDTDMAFTNPKSFRQLLQPYMEQTPLANIPGDPKGPARPGTVEEVANVVGMLTRPEAAWVTGSLVGCSGGMVMPH